MKGAVAAVLCLLAAQPVVAASCGAASPAQSVALVELYTSEGCSSCPPADRWLAGVADRDGRVVPLAFHVDYWNHLGWADPFSQARFSARQRQHAGLSGTGFVYTPQVVLQGRDFRGWGDEARFRELTREINRRPPGAKLNLDLSIAPGAVTVALSGTLRDAASNPAAQAFVALYEDGLRTAIAAGENAGRTLQHQRVVRVLLGPYPAASDGRFSANRIISLEGGWRKANLGVAAFVEDGRSGEVLQAMALPLCSG